MDMFTQMVGFIGLLLVVVSFQKNSRSFVLVLLMFAALAFGVHYFLLSAWTGVAMQIVSGARAYVFSMKDTKPWLNHPAVMYVFVFLFWIAGFITWQGYASIFPVIAMTCECFALWNNDTRKIRWLFFSARPFWLAYNLIVGSYAGIATEALVITSLLIAIVRFDILKKKEPSSST